MTAPPIETDFSDDPLPMPREVFAMWCDAAKAAGRAVSRWLGRVTGLWGPEFEAYLAERQAVASGEPLPLEKENADLKRRLRAAELIAEGALARGAGREVQASSVAAFNDQWPAVPAGVEVGPEAVVRRRGAAGGFSAVPTSSLTPWQRQYMATRAEIPPSRHRFAPVLFDEDGTRVPVSIYLRRVTEGLRAAPERRVVLDRRREAWVLTGGGGA